MSTRDWICFQETSFMRISRSAVFSKASLLKAFVEVSSAEKVFGSWDHKPSTRRWRESVLSKWISRLFCQREHFPFVLLSSSLAERGCVAQKHSDVAMRQTSGEPRQRLEWWGGDFWMSRRAFTKITQYTGIWQSRHCLRFWEMRKQRHGHRKEEEEEEEEEKEEKEKEEEKNVFPEQEIQSAVSQWDSPANLVLKPETQCREREKET